MEKKFKKGEVVWAKVRGFPWWPGVVRNMTIRSGKVQENEDFEKETKVLVNFIGDNSHSELPLNKVEKFDSKFDEFSKAKQRSLQNSVKLAKKIISGEIPFDKHMQYAKKIGKKNLDNVSSYI